MLLLAAVSATAQPLLPTFSSSTIRPHGRNTKLLAPGMVLELWGENLAPPGCGRDQIPKSQLPLELCGVQVLIDSQPAELMYVSSYQINLRIPPDAPSEGLVPFQVCVAGACSDPVPMRFSAHTA